MKYLDKTFQVAPPETETEEERKKREGYIWKEVGDGGYWLKSSNLHELGIPRECKMCGKLASTGLSNLDAATLDDWEVCKECYISHIEGREERIAKMAIAAIMNEEEEDDEIVRGAMRIVWSRGMKRWIKSNWPDKYDVIYGEG